MSPHEVSTAVGAALRPPSREHVLHVFPSFGIGGVPLRMVRIINHFGKRFRHTLIALDGNYEAAAGIAGGLDVSLWPGPGSTRGLFGTIVGSTRVLRRLRPDLLLTYNWGAIEWAMASRLWRVSRHVHLEAGFGRGESDSQIPRRVWFRRWALGRCELIVVPSRRLEALARGVWGFPPTRVAYLPNGVDTARFTRPVRDGLPGFARRREELVIGTVAPLRPEKNISRLIRVFASLQGSRPLRLVVAGDGAERGALERLAVELGIADRVIFAGQVAPEAVLGTFDIFALSSDTEQMPNALLEAMAAARPIAAVDVGDVKDIVCEGNREFIVPRDDARAFALAISRLLEGPAKRAELGRSNWERVVAEFAQERMFAAYSIVFGPTCNREAQ
jgi:glycosyltransferase involved in cell wall biosynthesis